MTSLIENFSVQRLEDVLSKLYGDDEAGRNEANRLLSEFIDDHRSLSHVTEIFTQSTLPSTQCQFYAISILDRAISERWLVLDPSVKENLKAFCIQLTGFLAQTTTAQRSPVLAKLNQTLVSIVKHEWPEVWSSFVSDIISGSVQGDLLTQVNVMEVFGILMVDIFDLGTSSMNRKRRDLLMEASYSSSLDILTFAAGVMKNIQAESNEQMRFQALSSFLPNLRALLKWVPPAALFAPGQFFIDTFFNNELVWNHQVSEATYWAAAHVAAISPGRHATLTGRMNRNVSPGDIDQNQLVALFVHATNGLKLYGLDGATIFDINQNFFAIQNIALAAVHFYAEYFARSSQTVEVLSGEGQKGAFAAEMVHDSFCAAMRFMSVAMGFENEAIMTVVLTFWSTYLTQMKKKLDLVPGGVHQRSFGSLDPSILPPFLQEYQLTFMRLRLNTAMVFSKPEEVLITVDENGAVGFLENPDVAESERYRICHNAYRKLCSVDNDSMCEFLVNEAKKFDATYSSEGESLAFYNLINRLSWAIGSLSGILTQQKEQSLVCEVLSPLLSLCKNAQMRETRGVVASCIMYICSKFPRFNNNHWNFLLVVTNKLMDFMNEQLPGVREMAIETFNRVVKGTANQYVIHQYGINGGHMKRSQREEPFIEQILKKRLPETYESFITEAHRNLLFKSLAYVISRAPNMQNMTRWLNMLINIQMERWQECLNELRAPDAQYNVQLFDRLRMVLSAIAAVNEVPLKGSFDNQLELIIDDIMKLYFLVSKKLEELQQIMMQGGQVDSVMMKNAIAVRQSIICVFKARIIQSGKTRNQKNIKTITHMIESLVSNVLSTYTQYIPDARDPEVLNLFAEIFAIGGKGGNSFSNYLPEVLQSLFQPTFEMISIDFVSYPEIRTAIFNLCMSMCENQREALAALPPAALLLMIQTLIFGVQHPTVEVCVSATSAFTSLMNFFISEAAPQTAVAFLTSFTLPCLKTVVDALTDSLHAFAFEELVKLMHVLLSTIRTLDTQTMNFPNCYIYIESNLAFPEFRPPFEVPTGTSNIEFVCKYVSELLKANCPKVDPTRFEMFALESLSVEKRVYDLQMEFADLLIDMKAWSNVQWMIEQAKQETAADMQQVQQQVQQQNDLIEQQQQQQQGVPPM